MMEDIPTLCSFPTGLNPDAIEYHDRSKSVLLAQYQLDEASRRKTGQLDVLRVAGASLERASSRPERAVFDARWRRGAGAAESDAGAGADASAFSGALVAVAADGGGVSINRLVDSSAALERVAELQLGEAGEAAPSALYVDWLCSGGASGASAGYVSGGSGGLVVARSDGCVSFVALDAPGGPAVAATWRAHSLGGAPIEVWVAAASPHASGAHTVWSGGDDSMLRGWDLRALAGANAAPGAGAVSTAGCAFASHAHRAGVTAVAFHPSDEHCVATGSYDEALRVWDTRRVAAGPVGELGAMGGGVWRVRWLPGASGPRRHALLAACMLGGAHIVDASTASGAGPRTVGHYAAHKSLVYGAEWLRGEREADSLPPLVATCSFYERQVHLWRVPGKAWGLLHNAVI